MSVTRRPFGAFGVAALSALALASFATPALAQSDLIVTFDTQGNSVTRTRALDISDLSLSTAAGRAAVEQRISLAAQHVCSADRMLDIRISAEYQRCYTQAKNDAMGKVASMQTASLN